MSFLKRLLMVSVLFVLIIVLAFSLVSRWDRGTVRITEVRSDYADIIRDSRGIYQGFVEIANNSDCPVDLTGWTLSNSPDDLGRFQLPDCTMEPGSRMLFWTGNRYDFAQPLGKDNYLGFSLREGDSVFLTNAYGAVTDRVRLPHLCKGDAWACSEDDGIWNICDASPGNPNNQPPKSPYVEVAAPVLSASSGFYEQEVCVSITAAPGTRVHYTLDGSIPGADSPEYRETLRLEDPTARENFLSARKDTALIHHRYLGPLERSGSHYVQRVNADPSECTLGGYVPAEPVPKIQILRAVAVDQEGNVSAETVGSYFIDYEDRYGFKDVYMLSVVVNSDDLFSDTTGIYVCGDLWNSSVAAGIDTTNPFWTNSYPTNYNISGKDRRRPARMELFTPEHSPVSSQMTGVNIHGGYSVAFQQKGFNISAFPKPDGSETLFPGVLDHDYRTLMLRPGGFRDTCYTKLRDALNMELVADRDITTLRAVPCQVFLNGEYWGLYNLQERIHQDTLAKKYGINENGIILLKTGRVVAGRPEDTEIFDSMVHFAVENDLSVSQNYRKISQMMDIQSYIDYVCMEVYVANCDSFGNNYAMWRTRHRVDDGYGDGRWRWIIYDTDDSSGVEENGITDREVDSFRGGHWVVAPATDELFSALCENEDFRLQFAETFTRMARTCFAPDRVSGILEGMADIYRAPAVLSQRRFLSGEFSEGDFDQQVEVIRDFFNGRYPYIFNYMVETLELEQYGYKKLPVQ